MTPTQYLKHLSYEVCSLIESGDHDLDKIQALINHGRSQLVIDDPDLRSQIEQSIELIAICYPMLLVKYELLGRLIGEAFAEGLDEVISNARDEVNKRETTEAKMQTILERLGLDAQLPRLTHSLQTILRAESKDRLLRRLVFTAADAKRDNRDICVDRALSLWYNEYIAVRRRSPCRRRAKLCPDPRTLRGGLPI